MPTTYTVTTGEHPKLLASTDDTTRTVSSLRGLAATDATDLARCLTEVERDLTRWTDDPAAFADQARALGLRTTQVQPEEGLLCVSVIADQSAPAAEVAYGPDTFRIHRLARILTIADRLPEAAQRAVRTELRDILRTFDGPVVTATIGCLDGPATLNAAGWLTHGEVQHLVDLLIGSWPDCAQAAEQVAWFYSAPGQALERAAHELVAAEADSIEVFLSLTTVVERLAATRPELLASAVAEVDEHGYDLEDDQATAIDRARTLLAPPPGH